MSGGGTASGVKGGQEVVATEHLGLGKDTDGVSGDRTDRGGGGYGRDGDIYGLNMWEDNVANIILGT